MGANERNAAKVRSGAAIAAAAASLFLGGMIHAPSAQAAEAKVRCAGVNACKGKSACATAKNGCKGQNACKAQGWLSMSERQCVANGGKVEKG